MCFIEWLNYNISLLSRPQHKQNGQRGHLPRRNVGHAGQRNVGHARVCAKPPAPATGNGAVGIHGQISGLTQVRRDADH